MTTSIARSIIVGCGTAIVLLLLVGCAPATDQNDGRISSFGEYSGYSEVRYDGSNRYSVYVPMPDGTQIAVDYFLPTAESVEVTEPVPVILHYTRYIRAREMDQGIAGVDGNAVLRNMLAHGYAVASADSRGTGASFGVHTGAFSLEETQDSYHIIEWLATQPWCDGNVGMFGRSYPGMTQYHAASQAPPALKAIFPEMAGSNVYDFIYRGGTYKEDFINVWGEATRRMDEGESGIAARVDADTDGTMRDAAVAGHGDNLLTAEVAAEAIYRDGTFEAPGGRVASWDEMNLIDNVDDFDRSGVAIYHLVGWYDIYTTQQAWLFTNITEAPQKMMIGPWVHSGGFGGDLHTTEVLRWYDYWLKGIENGIMDEPPVSFWIMRGNNTVPDDSGRHVSLDEDQAEDGAGWQTAQQWPPAGIEMSNWHLAAGPSGSVESVNDGNLISTSPATAARDEYTVDYTTTGGAFNRWRNGYGSSRQEPRGTTFFDERTREDQKALTYTSAVLDEDMILVGYPVVHLWVSSSHSDGDFFVYLEEVDAEGRSHYLTEGAIRASYRVLCDPPFDNFDLPYPCGLESAMRELSDQPVELVFELMGISYLIDAGHRIRISIAGADAGNHALFPDPAGGAPTISVHTGLDHASYVELPVYHER